MSEAVARARRAAIERAVDGDGASSTSARRAAFENRDDVPEGTRVLVAKVAKNAWKVTDEDVATAKQSGVSEDEIFELVICAAFGQATRQLDSALTALEKAKT